MGSHVIGSPVHIVPLCIAAECLDPVFSGVDCTFGKQLTLREKGKNYYISF